MKIVKLNETIDNLERVEDVQPVEGIVMADARQTSNKIDSKTVLERVREIVGEKAFLGAKEQPTPAEVKTPEPLTLDESLFMEAGAYEDEFDAEILGSVSKEDENSDKFNNSEVEADEEDDELETDEVVKVTADDDNIRRSDYYSNEEVLGMPFAYRANYNGTGKDFKFQDTKVWYWVVAAVYHACINPGGFNYVRLVPTLSEAIEPMISKYRDHSEPIGVNNRWNVQEREGLIVRAITLNPKWPAAAYAPGPDLEAWWKGLSQNTKFVNSIDQTTEIAKSTIHCNLDNHQNPIPGTSHTLNEFYPILDAELGKISLDDARRNGNLRNTAEKQPEADAGLNIGEIKPITAEPGKEVQKTASTAGSLADMMKAAGFDPTSLQYLQKEGLEDSTFTNATVGWKRSADSFPTKDQIRRMSVYKDKLNLEEDIEHPYIIDKRHFNKPVVKEICAKYGWSPISFCYDVFGDSDLYDYQEECYDINGDFE